MAYCFARIYINFKKIIACGFFTFSFCILISLIKIYAIVYASIRKLGAQNYKQSIVMKPSIGS